MSRFEASKKRRQLKERAVAYLGGSCELCGYNGCPSAFDFHHIQLWNKDFTISSHMTSWKRIEEELKKVVLLCCRCHREVHDGYHPGMLEEQETNLGGRD